MAQRPSAPAALHRQPTSADKSQLKKIIITRKAAFALKMRRYYTGKYCHMMHRAERYTATGHCVACVAERNAARKFVSIRNS